MLRRIAISLLCLLAMSGLPAFAQTRQAYTIDPSKIVHAVDNRIYSQFLEHIFNSVHGGLWGDMILNGGFVMNSGGGAWDIKDDMIYLTAPAQNQKVVLGDPNWTDYEITLDARKDSNGEGFIVMFRTSGDKFYWFNVGGWGGNEHGIEKNGGPVRRVPGKLEIGKWYKVRIRCEGPHIQTWLDDQPIIDVTDSKNPILQGAIGLNTWGNRASFKNIVVKSLDGKVLLNRLPTIAETSAAPPYWTYTGDGYCSFDKDDSLSGNGSVVLTCREDSHKVFASSYVGNRTSLWQHGISFVKGETYTGRIYMKSPDSASMQLRIVSGSVAFRFNNISPEWKPYDFQFVAKEEDPNGAVEVALDGKGTAKLSNFTLFSKTALDNGGFRPDILKAIKDIKPATIRYPGGCFASGYHWKDAIGPAEKRKYYPGEIWGDRDSQQMGTDEFMRLCEKVGAEPILAINKGLGVQEALDWMEYCNGPTSSRWGKLRADNGHPMPYNVKYWEIDNEVWWMQPEDYAKDVKTFSEAIKAKDPNAIIIACGSYAYDTGVGEGGKENWNKRLIDNAAQYFDFLSIHYYNGICVDQDYVQDPRKFEAFMRDNIGGLIKNSKNPKIRIYCSEWGQMNPEWRGGLYTASILNAFERQSDLVPMTCPAVWMQRISADKPNPRWTSCQILYDHKTFVPAPEYVVEKLWHDNFAPNLVKLDGPAEPLNAVATLSEDKKTLYFKVVNPTKAATQVELRLAKGTARLPVFTIVSPGAENAQNTLANTDKVRSVASFAGTNGRQVLFDVPALSAGVVKISLK